MLTEFFLSKKNSSKNVGNFNSFFPNNKLTWHFHFISSTLCTSIALSHKPNTFYRKCKFIRKYAGHLWISIKIWNNTVCCSKIWKLILIGNISYEYLKLKKNSCLVRRCSVGYSCSICTCQISIVGWIQSWTFQLSIYFEQG